MSDRIMMAGLAVALGLGGFVAGRMMASPPAGAAGVSGAQLPVQAPAVKTSGRDPGDSLFFFPFGPTPNQSPAGIQAGALVLEHLDTGAPAPCRAALKLYERLLPTENFGGEYAPLAWTCTWSLASPEQQTVMLADPDARRYWELFAPDEWSLLKQYLAAKYSGEPMENLWWVDEVLRFNGPGRAGWEHADEVMSLLDLKPGDVIADIGSGAGFYSLRFSDAVAPHGIAYAIEMNERHLDYIEELVKSENRGNLQPIQTDGVLVGVPPGSLDVAFMCSAYQAIYAMVRKPQREEFLTNLRASLKDTGRLVISESDPNETTGNPFGGISIAPEVIIEQLEARGFELVKQTRFIPQRYVLVFQPAKAGG